MSQSKTTVPKPFTSNVSMQTLSASTLQNAYGSIPYGMTNDYMFRATLQANNKALRGLVRSLLHLTEDEILSAKITNPIILGESANTKEFRLDINIKLNNRTLINLEMQVANKLNWPNRSILYLCRSFDSLNRGQDYLEAKPAVHIGFLDYTLFEDCPEFCATHKLMNVKNQHIYSDNFTLSVIDLSRIDLATDEDKKYHINDWASLFKATTWEEIKMLASKNEYLYEAAETIFQLNADEQIRKQCRDREEYYQDLRNYERVLAEKDTYIAQREAYIAEKDACIAAKDACIAEKDTCIAEKDALIQKLLEENAKLKNKYC